MGSAKRKPFIIIATIVVLVISVRYWFIWSLGESEIPILSRLSMPTSNKIRELCCGCILGTNDINSFMADGVNLPDEIRLTDYDKFMWIFSTHPVHRLSYSRGSEIIFLVPVAEKHTNTLYLVKTPRRESHNWVKMTAEVIP